MCPLELCGPANVTAAILHHVTVCDVGTGREGRGGRGNLPAAAAAATAIAAPPPEPRPREAGCLLAGGEAPEAGLPTLLLLLLFGRRRTFPSSNLVLDVLLAPRPSRRRAMFSSSPPATPLRELEEWDRGGGGEGRGSHLPRASPGGSPSSPSLLPSPPRPPPPPPPPPAAGVCATTSGVMECRARAEGGREAWAAGGRERRGRRATAPTKRRVDSYVQYIVKKSSSREELVTRRKKKEKKLKKKSIYSHC